MPKLPIFRLRNSEPAARPELRHHPITLALTGLQLGVDNLRYDVSLSPRLTADLSLHLARFVRRFGEVESLFDLEAPPPPANHHKFLTPAAAAALKPAKPAPLELKALLVSLHLAIVNQAKSEANPSIDLLGRLAVLKFLRTDVQVQYARVLEQCRTRLKALESLRQLKITRTHELVSAFQVRKKIILRRVGDELLHLLREIEKETLARTRRSLLGQVNSDSYRLFLNPLVFTDDGRDDYLCARHYYMFGNFDRDPDRFPALRQCAVEFLRELGYGEPGTDDERLHQVFNAPENADLLVGTGSGEDLTPEDRNRKERLDIWTRLLQRQGVLAHIVASYEAVPLLAEYAPLVNPQQIKAALLSREEADRVEKIIAEGRLSSDRLFAASARVAACRGTERARFAARFLRDLYCYHRDLCGLEALTAGFDGINLVSDSRLRELSTLNRMLYEFLPPEDQPPAPDRVLHHVILKADVRDSSRLTRSLMQKGMNAASYFSLNFYDPVNKILAKYGATKVFLEGDAIIVALFEHEAGVRLGVALTCALAWEIVNLLREYNELLERSGLPALEVGLGIAFNDSAPLYLMDGEHRIMISDAINESDRLSSCSKQVRKVVAPDAGVFQVYSVLIGGAGADAAAEEMRLNYNFGGICLSEPAFQKLQQEISLAPWEADPSAPGFHGPWVDDACQFFAGTVPLPNGTFRNLVIRRGLMPQVEVRDLSIVRWTDRYYYEVCAHPAVSAALEREHAANG